MSSQRISAALRQHIFETAQFRCGYCLTSQHIIGPLLEIEHTIPEAKGGTSEEMNLWVACPLCNSHKSDRIEAIDPETAARVMLFQPRLQRWVDHFTWSADGTIIVGKTPTGRATVLALQMNHPDIVAARRLWVAAGWHPPADVLK